MSAVVVCPACFERRGGGEEKCCTHGCGPATCVDCGAPRTDADPYWSCLGSAPDDAYTLALYPRPQPLDTPAARLEAVRHLMTPGVDEGGNEVPAVLTPEDALALLDAPLFDGVNREPQATRLADVTRELVALERAAHLDEREFRARDAVGYLTPPGAPVVRYTSDDDAEARKGKR